jgi:hypothetical protein
MYVCVAKGSENDIQERWGQQHDGDRDKGQTRDSKTKHKESTREMGKREKRHSNSAMQQEKRERDATPSNGRGHCFLLKHLAEYLQRNPSATNPITRRPVTQRQRDLVQAAYRRMVRRVPQGTRRQSAASTGGGGVQFVNFGPGTILRINGVRRTTDTGSLVITTTRSFGRDVIVVSITSGANCKDFRASLFEMKKLKLCGIHVFRWDGTPRQSVNEINWAICHYPSSSGDMIKVLKVLFGAAVLAALIYAMRQNNTTATLTNGTVINSVQEMELFLWKHESRIRQVLLAEYSKKQFMLSFHPDKCISSVQALEQLFAKLGESVSLKIRGTQACDAVFKNFRDLYF